MATENYLSVLEDSLNKKKAILERIVAYNEVQKEILSASDFTEEKFEANAEDKESCINEIDVLDEGFQRIYNRVKEELENNREAYVDQIKSLQSLIREVTELGVKIETQEKRNKELAVKRFAELRQELSSAKRSASMAKAYYQNMNKISSEPQFMDSKN